jgi:hypothetical protein
LGVAMGVFSTTCGYWFWGAHRGCSWIVDCTLRDWGGRTHGGDEGAIGLAAHADMLRPFHRELLWPVRPAVGALPVLHLHNTFQCKLILFGILWAKA